MSAGGWALAGAGAVAALYAAAVLGLILAGRRTHARALAGIAPDCAVLLRRLARDGQLSRPRRVVLVVCAAYVLFPLDAVPDFIPVAGQLDDAVVVGLGLRIALRSAGAAAVVRHWPGPAASLRLVLWLAGLSRPAKALR
jgi:uncharacterized membrane protein YkvA (DUF1232 family)